MGEDARVIVETDIREGIRLMPLSIFYERHIRICRPVGLPQTEIDPLVDYAIGSEDPTRARCSSLFAQAFHCFGYPTLPFFSEEESEDPWLSGVIEDCTRIRHHSLFAPGDFDLSPDFDIIKSTVESGFDPKQFNWNGPGTVLANADR